MVNRLSALERVRGFIFPYCKRENESREWRTGNRNLDYGLLGASPRLARKCIDHEIHENLEKESKNTVTTENTENAEGKINKEMSLRALRSLQGVAISFLIWLTLGHRGHRENPLMHRIGFHREKVTKFVWPLVSGEKIPGVYSFERIEKWCVTGSS